MRIKGFQYFGTGAGLPSPKRTVSAMAVDFENEWFLFDCGEGTQQQVMVSKLKFSRLTRIFISHFHGDHLYGLPGMLATMQLQGVDHKLTIYAPVGIKDYIHSVFKLSGTKIKREIEFIEIPKSKKLIDIASLEYFDIKGMYLSHRIPCLGYRLVMKDLPGKFDSKKADELGIPKDKLRRNLIEGRSIKLENGNTISPEDVVSDPVYNPDFTYVTDTRLCDQIMTLAMDSDILHHECTFTDDEIELAEKSGHVTFGQVLKVADTCKTKQLLLAHFSSRYDHYRLQKQLESKPYHIEMTRDLKYYPIQI